jgi:uncharacterized protein (DUF1697 family)
VNVGGHTVTMDRLRASFDACGLGAVETVIARGNVAFTSAGRNARAHERAIAVRLRRDLGYAVDAFIRTPAELAEIAERRPFSETEISTARAHYVAFLADAPEPGTRRAIAAWRTDVDAFAAVGREIHWLCVKTQSGSTFSNAVLEKRLGVRATIRNLNTIRRLAGKYRP